MGISCPRGSYGLDSRHQAEIGHHGHRPAVSGKDTEARLSISTLIPGRKMKPTLMLTISKL